MRGVQGCVYNEYPAEVKGLRAIRETTAQNMKEIRPDKDTHPLIPSQEGKTDNCTLHPVNGYRETGALNVESFFRRYNKNILSLFHKEIRELQKAGLIEITGSGCSFETNLRLTKKGLMLSNEVFEKFI